MIGRLSAWHVSCIAVSRAAVERTRDEHAALISAPLTRRSNVRLVTRDVDWPTYTNADGSI